MLLANWHNTVINASSPLFLNSAWYYLCVFVGGSYLHTEFHWHFVAFTWTTLKVTRFPLCCYHFWHIRRIIASCYWSFCYVRLNLVVFRLLAWLAAPRTLITCYQHSRIVSPTCYYSISSSAGTKISRAKGRYIIYYVVVLVLGTKVTEVQTIRVNGRNSPLTYNNVFTIALFMLP